MKRAVGPCILALLLVAVAPMTPTSSWADPTVEQLQDERRRAEGIEARRAEAVDELSRTEAELRRFEQELTATQAELDAAERILEAAEVAAQAAIRELELAQARLGDAERRLVENEVLLGSLARDTYMYGHSTASPQLAAFDLVTTSETVDALANGLYYLERGLGARTAAIQESAALQDVVRRSAGLAEQRAVEARQGAALAATARDDAATIHARIDGLLAESSVRLERQARSLDDLEQDRADTAASIEALERQVRRERAERRERERAVQRADERTEEASAGQGADAPASAPAGSSTTGGVPEGGLVQVGGITVAASLGPALEQLLADARADGIVLGGAGWRSSEVQAALRRANGCPDVYESPASACRVPTARPGTSEHERGLAIDFTWQGRTICFPSPASACRGNAAFDWLQDNASRYGLYVLPSEAWHWSTTGR